MTCQHCDVELPPYALFCGECGRSVSAPAVVPPVVRRPTVPSAQTPVAQTPVPQTPVPQTAVPQTPVTQTAVPLTNDAECTECGTPCQPEDRYCGECGRPQSSDTSDIERLPSITPVESTESTDPPPPLPLPLPLPLPSPSPPELDLEDTPLVQGNTGGVQFVLQFSTGESYAVFGSGLAGRNPRPEPGEYFDHVVTIVDPARSVSKTHVEFGQEGGVFWVSDRHSGNGTVIREPGAEARPGEPGRRYPVVRGTRIDLGEQFVIVS